MKKATTMAIAAVASLSLVSGGIFAWFVARNDAEAVNVGTGTIVISSTQLISNDPVHTLPGDVILLNDPAEGANNDLINSGTRNMIVELSMLEESFN